MPDNEFRFIGAIGGSPSVPSTSTLKIICGEINKILNTPRYNHSGATIQPTDVGVNIQTTNPFGELPKEFLEAINSKISGIGYKLDKQL